MAGTFWSFSPRGPWSANLKVSKFCYRSRALVSKECVITKQVNPCKGLECCSGEGHRDVPRTKQCRVGSVLLEARPGHCSASCGEGTEEKRVSPRALAHVVCACVCERVVCTHVCMVCVCMRVCVCAVCVHMCLCVLCVVCVVRVHRVWCVCIVCACVRVACAVHTVLAALHHDAK